MYQGDQPTMLPSKMQDFLGSVLEGVATGKIKRLIVMAPPGSSKSELISRHFPAYYLGLHPDHKIVHCCYGWNLVRDFSRSNQDDVSSPKYREFFPGLRLDPKRHSLSRWGLDQHNGTYIAEGVGGAITGNRANGLIIDDPIKSRKDAESKQLRDDQFKWFFSVARSRLTPDGFIIIVLTRWHQDDLVGRLLALSRDGHGEEWRVLRLPALAEENDVLGRKPGESVWPEMWPVEKLVSIRDSMPDDYEWNALYQQHPTPPGGSIFRHEWWRVYDPALPVHLTAVVASWDTAFKDGEENDYSAVWTGAIATDGHIKVLDVAKIKATTADLIGTPNAPGLIARYAYWLAGIGLRLTAMPIEDKGSGTAAIQMLAMMHPDLPIVAVPVPPGRGKVERARAVANLYKSGRVQHRKDAPWRAWFEPLCEEFPGGSYDDPVDAMSQGLMQLLLPPKTFVEVYEGPRVSLGRY